MGNGHGYSIDLEIEHDISNIVSLKVMIDEISIMCLHTKENIFGQQAKPLLRLQFHPSALCNQAQPIVGIELTDTPHTVKSHPQEKLSFFSCL